MIPEALTLSGSVLPLFVIIGAAIISFIFISTILATEKAFGMPMRDIYASHGRSLSEHVMRLFENHGAGVAGEVIGLPRSAFVVLMPTGERVLFDFSCWDEGRASLGEIVSHERLVEKTRPDTSFIVTKSGKIGVLGDILKTDGIFSSGCNPFKIASLIRRTQGI